MKLFLDTANLEEIREIKKWGVLGGLTSNSCRCVVTPPPRCPTPVTATLQLRKHSKLGQTVPRRNTLRNGARWRPSAR